MDMATLLRGVLLWPTLCDALRLQRLVEEFECRYERLEVSVASLLWRFPCQSPALPDSFESAIARIIIFRSRCSNRAASMRAPLLINEFVSCSAIGDDQNHEGQFASRGPD